MNRLRWILLLATSWVTTFAAPPRRVVSQTVGTDEMLVAIAAPEQIAALSHLSRDADFSAVADEAKRFPQLVLGDAETVLKYAPDLVLAADYSRPELIEQIRRAGVRVLVFDRYKTIDDTYVSLRRLGRELGPEASARAEKVVAECQERLRVLAERLREVRLVRVIAPSTYGVIAGADTTFQDLCDHAGAMNLAATLGHLRGHEAPPNEQMLGWPIEKVVVAGPDIASALSPYRKLPPYQYLSAVRENRVALLDMYMLSSVTHRRIDGYERLARELHPEVFK